MNIKLNIFNSWEERRNNTFLTLLKLKPNHKVLDLGCGNGGFTILCRKRIGCKKIYGVDISKKNLNQARKKGIIVKKNDLNKKLPFDDNSFDVVISNQVIEHLFYPVNFIKEIYRILKPNGYAVISTENLSSWDNIFALTVGYTPFSMEFDGGLRKIGNPISLHEKEVVQNYSPHVRIVTWKGLIEITKFVGFKVNKIVGNGHIFGKLGELINQKNCRFITIGVIK